MASPFQHLGFEISRERSILLACIGISLLIWVFVKLSKEYQTTKVVQIEYKLPPMMEFVAPPPASILATVEGSGLDLFKKALVQRNPVILIDLAKLPDPAVQRSDLMNKIQQETSLKVRNINRNYLSFEMDSTATKKVPVELNATLDFKRDFFQNRPLKITPDSILIAGPQKELELVESISTVHWTFSGINGPIQKELLLNQDALNHITLHPDRVQFELSADQYTEKPISVPIQMVNATVNHQISPAVAELVCVVSLSDYERLAADSFLLEADLENKTRAGHQKSVPVLIQQQPAWVKAIRLSPKSVEFLIID